MNDNGFKKQLEDKSSNDLMKELREKQQQKNEKVDEIKKAGREIKFWSFIVIQAIISLGLIGFAEIFNADFSFDYIATANFWWKFFLLQTANISLILVITLVLARRKRVKNVDYLLVKEEKKELVEYDKQDPYIENECVEEDYRRKTNAWKNKVKRKREKWRLKIKETPIPENLKVDNVETENTNLLELDDTSKYSQIETFISEPSNYTVREIKSRLWLKKWWFKLKEKKRVKRNTKIKTKLLEYNYMLTDEYIIENIDSIKIKYNRVTKTMILSDMGYEFSQYGDERIKINRSKILTKKYTTKILVTAFISAVSGSIMLEVVDTSIVTWFNVILKLVILIVNAMITIIDNEEYFYKTDMYEMLISKNLLEKMKLKHLRQKSVENDK